MQKAFCFSPGVGLHVRVTQPAHRYLGKDGVRIGIELLETQNGFIFRAGNGAALIKVLIKTHKVMQCLCGKIS